MLALACNGVADDDEDTGPDDTGVALADNDNDGYLEDVDCDDEDPSVHPDAPEEDCTDPKDYNCDGVTPLYADTDRDGYAACEDCNDNVPAINPAADEICDGIDNDCDAQIDDADDSLTDGNTYFQDSDSDTYGNAEVTAIACRAPNGYVEIDGDCDDAERLANPGATEVCDGIDNDCDEAVDDADDSVSDQTTWYPDLDEDGLGNPDAGLLSCEQPEGYILDGFDCDDGDPDAGIASTWYEDLDADGYGNAARSRVACEAPADHIAVDGDCNDRNSDINPDAIEVCDRVDNDCDSDVDDADSDVEGTTSWWPDDDEDGFGDEDAVATDACVAPSKHVDDNTDCDDADALVKPGAFDWDDDKDNDCDTSVDEDVGTETYTHDSDVQSIWNSKCTGCHGSSGGISLASSAYSRIVNASSSTGMDFIEPGDPDNSYIWRKIEGTHSKGSAMPLGGSLTTAQKDTIETWILEGAVK